MTLVIKKREQFKWKVVFPWPEEDGDGFKEIPITVTFNRVNRMEAAELTSGLVHAERDVRQALLHDDDKVEFDVEPVKRFFERCVVDIDGIESPDFTDKKSLIEFISTDAVISQHIIAGYMEAVVHGKLRETNVKK